MLNMNGCRREKGFLNIKLLYIGDSFRVVTPEPAMNLEFSWKVGELLDCRGRLPALAVETASTKTEVKATVIRILIRMNLLYPQATRLIQLKVIYILSYFLILCNSLFEF